MLLAIDIGNTNVLMGVFEEGSLKNHLRLDSRIRRTSDEWGSFLVIQFTRLGLKTTDITSVITSSVVPILDFTFAKMVNDYFQQDTVFVHAGLDLGITIGYKNPEQVGADRLCNAVAVLEKYSTPIIIIDFGTATTFDVIVGKNEYLGGIIAPGIETAANILHLETAKLPLVGMTFPARVIGRTTENSIQAGILYGALVEAEGLIRRIEDEIGAAATVVGTGGFANLFAEHTNLIPYIEPFLTLNGLYLIYQRIHSIQ